MRSLPSHLRKGMFTLAAFGAVPLLAACPKKETPAVVDAAPPPPPPVEDAAPLNLMPVEEDAGVDAGVDAGPKKYGPGVSTNVLRLQQCCAAIGKMAQPQPGQNAPELAMIQAAATQCKALAAQAGASGNAPEMGLLRNMLAGKTLPPVCAGF